MSRRFYEQFGDEVTNELVNWFNAVDETYRNQLRELKERLDAKFDAKFAEVERRMFKAMFWFWTATIVPLAALIVTLSGALQK